MTERTTLAAACSGSDPGTLEETVGRNSHPWEGRGAAEGVLRAWGRMQLETAGQAGAFSAPAWGEPVTILVLEDEPALRRLHRELLEGEGCAVLEAPSLGAAVQLAETHTGPIDVLLADVGAGGLVAARSILSSRPDLRVILTSGSHEEPAHDLGDRIRFLRKPVRFAVLIAAIQGDS